MSGPEVPLSQKSVSGRSSTLAPDVYAPGHLGELTQIIDSELVDAVLEETGTRERRLRLLPARVVVYFVLALVFFERSSYRAVWDKLTAGLIGSRGPCPCSSSLSRARRRLRSEPLRRLFDVLAGPVADRSQACALYRGLHLVAIDRTTLSAPDEEAVTWYYRKHIGTLRTFGHPLVRLVAIVECGTRAFLGAAFGSDRIGSAPRPCRRLLPDHHLQPRAPGRTRIRTARGPGDRGTGRCHPGRWDPAYRAVAPADQPAR
ncbi:transposase domain-containing protein [Streptacidiphilus sp. EB103A]|uniref:transposase domain-containing protein n=1 Tax=Streptacidiphilus sp. EB103A TaxID=3156275 RepID=UPI0035174A21